MYASSAFAQPLNEPIIAGLLRKNQGGILAYHDDSITCTTLRQYLDNYKFAGGTKKYPSLLLSPHQMCSPRQYLGPKVIGHGASDGLIQQEYDSVVCWFAVAKRHRATLPDAEIASQVKIRLTTYQVLKNWNGVTCGVCFQVHGSSACIFVFF